MKFATKFYNGEADRFWCLKVGYAMLRHQIMILLPVVGRELRVASRRRGTYASRVTAALISILIGGWIMMTLPKFLPSTAVGAEFFKVLSWFAWVYVLIAGTRATADAISSEKRQGTLGLLFLTDLKGYDVLMGKLAASSLETLYGLIAILPVLAIPLLMGGVTGAEFGRVGLAVFATLLFSLSAGIFASSVSYVERKAVGSALLIVGIIAGGIPLCAAMLEDAALGTVGIAHALRPLSPAYACYMAFDTNYASLASEYWISLVLTFLFSILLLSIASRATARVWSDKPQRTGQFGWRERWRGMLRGPAQTQREFRRRLLDVNAVYWLASRERWVRYYPWMLLASIAAIWCWGLFVDRDFVGLEICIVVFYVLHFIFKYWFVNIACQGLSTDREQGALETILSTPLTLREIVRGQWLALCRLFFWPFAVLIAVEVLLTIWNVTFPSMLDGHDIETRTNWIAFAGCSAILLVMDSIALGCVGFWQSLFSKTPHQAATAAMSGVLLIAQCVFGLLFGAFSMLRIDTSPLFFVAVWFVIGGVADVFFVGLVWRRFRRNLRYVVSERAGARPVQA